MPEPVTGIPSLTKKQRPIFVALLTAELRKRDRSDTAWLKQIVTDSGWPTFSSVGEDASRRAWLLAQHADQDPVFQLKVLRLMEPLVGENEVSNVDYAYLYDSVMLKLVGTQRFATQVTCQGGRRVPIALEDIDKMPEYRATVGMEPFEQYLTNFRACPVG